MPFVYDHVTDVYCSIPNIPFFYLVFRAYSHYRALYGGRLLEHIVKKDLVQVTDSKQMDAMYAAGLLHPTREVSRDAAPPSSEQVEQVAKKIAHQTTDGEDESMLLQRWNGKLIAEAFHLPEMEVEIERAVEQVEKAINDKAEPVKEKEHLVHSKAQESEKAEEAKR